MSSFVAFALKGRQTCQFIFGANVPFNTFTTLKSIWLACILLFVEVVILSLVVSHSFSKKLDKQVSSSSLLTFSFCVWFSFCYVS